MRKPQIKKETLKEVIRLYIDYYNTSKVVLLAIKNEKCCELSKQIFGFEDAWLAISEIVGGPTKLHCILGMDITYETIYKVFELLGFEIVDEEEKK